MEKNLGATSAPSSYLGWSGIDNDCDQAILELRLPTTPSTELPIKKFLLFMNWSSSKKEKLESGPKEYTRQRGWHLARDRMSTRLNSSHVAISYAVFCLKKKKISKRPV